MRAWLPLVALLVACHAPSARPLAAPKAAEKKETATPPADKELQLENAMGILVEEILSTTASEYGDRTLNEYVTSVGARVAKRSERPEITWHFRVSDAPYVGAHALPGGRVTITRGLLAYLGSEAEVAAVLAHEIAHVSFRHSHSKWSPSVPVGEVGEEADARERARDADQERQADTVGIRYLAEAGYDPNAMVSMLAALERGAAIDQASVTAKKDRPEILREEDDFDPHPAPPARLARAAVAASANGTGEWRREEYLSKISGLEWGDGSSVPVLENDRWVARGELSVAVPRGYRAKIEHGMIEMKAVGKEVKESIIVFRLKKSFLSEALRASAIKGRTTTRTVAGWDGLVARAPDPKTVKSKKKDDKKEESLMAILDGPTKNGAQPVVLVFVSGNTAASERLLDRVLASAEVDTSTPKPSAVLAIERPDAVVRFGDFVAARCPSTLFDVASALNGRAAADPLRRATPVKCVKQAER